MVKITPSDKAINTYFMLESNNNAAQLRTFSQKDEPIKRHQNTPIT
jgi:hypothetical protein